MAQLTETGRKHIARKNFAYVDKEGREHLPIHDADHVRNAIARFNQTAFESVDAKGKRAATTRSRGAPTRSNASADAALGAWREESGDSPRLAGGVSSVTHAMMSRGDRARGT